MASPLSHQPFEGRRAGPHQPLRASALAIISAFWPLSGLLPATDLAGLCNKDREASAAPGWELGCLDMCWAATDLAMLCNRDREASAAPRWELGCLPWMGAGLLRYALGRFGSTWTWISAWELSCLTWISRWELACWDMHAFGQRQVCRLDAPTPAREPV